MKNLIKNPPVWFVAISLILGASCLGVSPLFVRISEVGPISTAFWRSSLAIPFIIFIFYRLKLGSIFIYNAKLFILLIIPGIFLGIDHAAWHHGIMMTSIANATLFASIAPIFVVIYGYILFSWVVSKKFIYCLILSITGSLFLLYNSLEFNLTNFFGDLWSLLAGAFYGAYLISTGLIRDRNLNPYIILFYTSLSSAVIIYIIYLFSNESIMPLTYNGWFIVLILALISQVFGIGLITWALGKVKTGLASLTLMSEPVTAALLAWIFIGEYLSFFQLLGGFIIIFSILYAQNSSELKD